MIRVHAKTEQAKAALERLAARLHDVVEEASDKTAAQVLALMVEATPKKWFGAVRAGWQIENMGYGVRRVFNDRPKAANGVPIIVFLEHGTANEGQGFIYPVRARALYIPLKRTAITYRKGLKFGVDYVLAKRVRGIKPRRIVAGNIDQVQQIQRTNMMEGVRRAIHGQ